MKRHQRAAFTLLEFVLVAAIMAVFSAIAIPRIGNSIQNQRTDWVARRIVADLAYAQQLARTESRAITVTFYPNDPQTHYKLIGVRHPDRPDQDYDVTLSGEHESVDVTSVDFGGSRTLKFDGYGRPISGGTIILGSGASQRVITVNGYSGKATVN